MMKKLIVIACVFGLAAMVFPASAGTAQANLADELALKQLGNQQPVVRIVNPKGSVNFGGDTSTGGTPTWTRPYSVGDGTSGSCTLSGSGTAVPYNTQDFHVDTTTTYTIDATWDGFDGFLHLYEVAFDPNDQCVNLIALNDDGSGTGDSQIADQSLTAGVQYIVVVGGFGNSDSGPYSVTISSATGTPILGTVPVELQSFNIE